MTRREEDLNAIVVGACPYQCYLHFTNWAYYPVSDYECITTTRDGQLCGRCKTGCALPVYSYGLQCTACSHNRNAIVKRWAKYITIAFLPLAIFFVIVVTLRISASMPSLIAFNFVSQLSTIPLLSRIYIPVLQDDIVFSNRSTKYFLFFFQSLYGIWNLDFFRTFYNSLCLHPNMNVLQVLALDYIIAGYPLLLIMVTYALVSLHDHNFNFVIWLWKPFRRCFIRFRRHWDIKTSLIDAFATFFLLSYVKFFSVSFDLLIPVRLYNVQGDQINQTYVYYNATVPYFGRQHLPYAALAITVIVLFNLLPIVLLCLYPCKCFQKMCDMKLGGSVYETDYVIHVHTFDATLTCVPLVQICIPEWLQSGACPGCGAGTLLGLPFPQGCQGDGDSHHQRQGQTEEWASQLAFA